jgi:S-DNA-T family DNA segregation ATPase FtsK/SpoIIIE
MTSTPRVLPERALRVTLPRPPQHDPPHGFPWLATLAPVIGAVGLWVFIESIYALAFAALGPIIAVASVGDARVSARRTRRRERARFDRDCARTREAIAAAHGRERATLAHSAPSARSRLTSMSPDPERWRGSFGEPLLVRLGEGSVLSLVDVDGATDADDRSRAALDELRAAAALVPDAPVVVDARLGIGFYGPRPLTLAAARAVVVQLAAALSPGGAQIQVTGGVGTVSSWRWVTLLPHEADVSAVDRPDAPAQRIAVTARASVADVERQAPPAMANAPGAPEHHGLLVAVAETPAELPRHVRVIVSVSAAGGAIVRHPDRGALGELMVHCVSEREAAEWARRQAEAARVEGFPSLFDGPPDTATLRDTLQVAADADISPRGLRSPIGLGGGDGVTGRRVIPVTVDLIDDGPHAIVGGTTGSGKSELLISWVVAMASSRAPSEVAFLFVDFKGGAAFEPLRLLPHSVGMITDLDAHQAHRALSSLRAEVRHRERTLAAAGVRSIDEWTDGAPLARLVIVVDEYAAMLEEHPGLHALFVDLASRGRSLGIHLVLCTQRPGGVVRDSILANCGLRLCLRVNNAPDSIGVLGSTAAAALPSLPRGRAVLRVHGGSLTLFQVARTVPSDIAAVTERWSSHPRTRPPWRAPLPTVITSDDLNSLDVSPVGADFTLPFALVDYPDQQLQSVGRYAPTEHGNMVVVGARGSGKTTVLGAFASAPTRLQVHRVASTLASVWDAAHAALASDVPHRVILLDDVDALIAGCPDDYDVALVELLTRLLREGPGRGVTTVLAAQRLPGPMNSLAALCGAPLLMRTTSRQEHLLAGGDSADWDPDLPPGAGIWRGDRLQVVLPETAEIASPATPPAFVPQSQTPLAVVSTRPAEMAERLRLVWPGRRVIELGPATADPASLFVSVGSTPEIVIGHPDAWNSRWGALAALRETTETLFDGCGIGEFRSLTSRNDLPPPFDRGERPLWLLRTNGSVGRAALPAPT